MKDIQTFIVIFKRLPNHLKMPPVSHTHPSSFSLTLSLSLSLFNYTYLLSLYCIVLKATSTDVAGDCGRIRDLANVIFGFSLLYIHILFISVCLSSSISLSLLQKVLDRLFDEPPSERSCPYGVQQPRGGGGGGGGSVGMATSYSSNGMGGDSLLGG